jgi:hypothetical protein
VLLPTAAPAAAGRTKTKRASSKKHRPDVNSLLNSLGDGTTTSSREPPAPAAAPDTSQLGSGDNQQQQQQQQGQDMSAPPSPPAAAAAAADVLVLDDAAYEELPDAAGLEPGEFVEADFHLTRCSLSMLAGVCLTQQQTQ